jgi:two-component system chemotaxis response regulator CheY
MPSLLIVDDSATIRKMIMAALRPLNPTFGEASTGLEAIEQLTLHPYDAITLDLNMPDMHGLEFLRFVRGMETRKNVPIIVVTTRGDGEMHRAVLSAGADRYISKPFAPSELLDSVKSLINP